jgi:hypothetical protein
MTFILLAFAGCVQRTCGPNERLIIQNIDWSRMMNIQKYANDHNAVVAYVDSYVNGWMAVDPDTLLGGEIGDTFGKEFGVIVTFIDEAKERGYMDGAQAAREAHYRSGKRNRNNKVSMPEQNPATRRSTISPPWDEP